MKRRTILVVSVTLVLAVSLAAVAGIFSSGPRPVAVTPQVHKQGAEGYFRVEAPLPADAPKGGRLFVVKVDEGDVYLAHAVSEARGEASPDESETRDAPAAKKAAPAERTVTVTGRFSRPGPARLTVLDRAAKGEPKPLLRVSFTLPEADAAAPAVRTAWARQEQWALFSADPEGEDSFSQYWNLAIAPRYGLKEEYYPLSRNSRREPPDLYSVFTGAAAIQESLQLETLGGGRDDGDGDKKDNGVALASLAGPSVKSHPFREMLKGRTPALPPLAALVPEDQYAVFFRDITKEIELADLMDEWGGNLLHQVQSSARDFKVRGKISGQLCLENSLLTRWFGDRVVADMAFTGRDPFLKEGTDMTVLFSLKDGKRFRKQLEKRYAEAVRHGAIRTDFTLGGFPGMAVVSPGKGISSHTLFMDGVALVATTRPALERIVAVHEHRLHSLALADDFRYMRTIFPQGSDDEDIFIYLSDAHIRNLVGPRWKIGEARRMRCAANLALVANARLWFRAEQRREPTMAELVSGGYLGAQLPRCPDHGAYELDGGVPHCSLHNRNGLLAPVGEVPLERVTSDEAEQYRSFVEGYNRYWTKFFDPIGIRVKMGKDIRIQTCILPLIENSWYDGLAEFSGRTPGALSEKLVLPRTVISLRGHVDPKWLRETALLRHLSERNFPALGWLGDELSLNLCDGPVLFSASGQAMGLLGQEVGRRSSLEPLIIGYLGSALNLPTYLSVKVTDAKQAEQAIPALFNALGPYHSRDEFSVETYSLDTHQGKPLYVANFNLWVIKLRLYAAVIDDRLVIASRKDVITDLMDAQAKQWGGGPAAKEGNMELSLYRSAFKQLEEVVNLGYQEDIRHACQKNLPLAAIMLNNLGLPADHFVDETGISRGYTPYCPSGGHYLSDPATGAVTCSVHGNRYHPRQPAASDRSSATLKLVNTLERVNTRLSFTPEGLMTTVDIRRSGD